MGCNTCMYNELCDPHEKQIKSKNCRQSYYRLSNRGKSDIWKEMSYRQVNSNWGFEKSEWDEYLELEEFYLIVDMMSE